MGKFDDKNVLLTNLLKRGLNEDANITEINGLEADDNSNSSNYYGHGEFK